MHVSNGYGDVGDTTSLLLPLFSSLGAHLTKEKKYFSPSIFIFVFRILTKRATQPLQLFEHFVKCLWSENLLLVLISLGILLNTLNASQISSIKTIKSLKYFVEPLWCTMNDKKGWKRRLALFFSFIHDGT